MHYYVRGRGRPRFYLLFLATILATSFSGETAWALPKCAAAIVDWAGNVFARDRAAVRQSRAQRPGVEGMEDRVVPALVNPVYGNVVKEVLEVVSANSRQGIVNAEVTVKAGDKVYPGGTGTTGLDGVFRGSFNNTDDVFGYEHREVYVPPTYDYHYGYNPATGNYEYFYGYEYGGGHYEDQLVPVYDYTSQYTVVVKAPGFETLTKLVNVNFNSDPSSLHTTLALTLVAPPSYAAAYATAVVEEVLHREPSSAEVATLSNALRSNTPDQVALGVLQTPESERGLVLAAYQNYVGAGPAPKVQKNLVQALAKSGNEDGMVSQIVTSAPYARAHGAAPRRLATSLYQSLLGRDPTAKELKSAAALVTKPASKQTLVTHLLQSSEYRVRQITAWSQIYLGVNPDANSTKIYLAQWKQGTTTLQIRAEILAGRAR